MSTDINESMDAGEALATNTAIVVGIVAATGCDLRAYESALVEHFKAFNYRSTVVSFSRQLQVLKDRGVINTDLAMSPEHLRISTHMDGGNDARLVDPRLLALCAINEVAADQRSGVQPRSAYILSSLKHPAEVRVLRDVYGPGFFLFGINASRADRMNHLTMRGMSRDEAKDLMERDEYEPHDHGQKTRDTFHLADAFVSNAVEIRRVVDLLFGSPRETPTRDEHAMFLAFAGALRSGDLSRQVGAVVVSGEGEVIGIGCNDAPAAKGGQYWASKDAQRDLDRRFDSNEREKGRIIKDAAAAIATAIKRPEDEVLIRETLGRTRLDDITEYGRAVHAEMEALLSCARNGVSPRGGTLYSTTFPCHNCAKHIVAAGLSRVVYVEPYPKSMASELHDDSIAVGDDDAGCKDKVRFMPFNGIGPRRYFDLFSMDRSSGYRVRRKKKNSDTGMRANWPRTAAELRVPMRPTSFVGLQEMRAKELLDITRSTSGKEAKPVVG